MIWDIIDLLQNFNTINISSMCVLNVEYDFDNEYDQTSVVKNIDISISIDTEISERYQYKFSEVSILRS